MITFLTGLLLLILGAAVYGRICVRVFVPDDRKTPAERLLDGVDYVPMKQWKNCLIQLLNIAGTGPIFGPIQGILFGPIAFVTIPIGCVLGGAFHDYMSGMISIREDGAQMPSLIQKYLGKITCVFYNLFVFLLLILVGAVFIYTPGDLFVTQILKSDGSTSDLAVWLVYGAIFIYYIIAMLFPIDKIIGSVYPVFGGILLLSALGVFAGIFVKGYPLDEIWEIGVLNVHPQGLHFIPVFFCNSGMWHCSRVPCNSIDAGFTYDEAGKRRQDDFLQYDGHRRVYCYGMGSSGNGRDQSGACGYIDFYDSNGRNCGE